MTGEEARERAQDRRIQVRLGIIAAAAAIFGSLLSAGISLWTTRDQVEKAATAASEQSRTDFFRQDRRQLYAQYLATDLKLVALENEARDLMRKIINRGYDDPEDQHRWDRDYAQIQSLVAELGRGNSTIALSGGAQMVGDAERLYQHHANAAGEVYGMYERGTDVGGPYGEFVNEELKVIASARKEFIADARHEIQGST